jgi:hypothetical protein
MWKPVLTSAIVITEGTQVSGLGHASTRWFGTWCLATLCFAGFGGPVLAGELGYGAGYLLIYDSNINRVPSGALAEWTQILLGSLSYQERSVDFNAQIGAQVERRNYRRNTFSDQTVYQVNGAAVWTISPQQFTWTVEDVARQVQLNITAPDTPSNRSNANAFRTGPDFTFHLDPTNNVDIGARYNRYTIDGPGDTRGYSVSTAWVHRVSQPTTLSLNYVATRLFPQDQARFHGPHVDLEQGFLRFQTSRPLGALSFDVGTSSATQEGVASSASAKGRLARLVFSRPLTSTSSLRVSFDSQYFVNSTELLAGVTSPTQPTDGAPSTPPTIVATQDTYYSRGGDIVYQTQSARRFAFTLGGSARRVDYSNPLSPDFEERAGRIEGTWLPSATARVGARMEYVRDTFPQLFRQDHRLSTGVSVAYSPTQNVNISVAAERIAQSSSLSQFDFVDQRAILSLTYTSGPLRR